MTRKSYTLPQLNGAVFYVPPKLERNGMPPSSIATLQKTNSVSSEKDAGLPAKTDITKVNAHEHRGQWSRGLEFLFSCISMSVGLGNVWRFPNVTYNNGGGAFLIPYLILLFVIGRPMYYMELIFGQFSSRGPVKVWKCVPLFKGVGYAQLVSTSYLIIFYNYLMALTLFYLFASMQNPLPWTECDPTWALDISCSAYNTTVTQVASMHHPENNDTLSIVAPNMTKRVSLPEQYWLHYVLRQSSGLGEMTWLNWRLALCLILSWFLVYLTIMKGVQSVGKVVYFTATFPYVILISLLIVALFEDGSINGIIYFFKPKWEKLLDISVWYKACEQSFFSLTVGYGTLVMYSSYNSFNNNVYKDAIIISILDTFTSILAGCVIFSVLGTLAYELNIDIDEAVNKAGMGLAFVAYPEALGKINFVPQLWSVLFFIMLFTLGIGSSVSQIETVLTCIKDAFPQFHQRKWFLAMVACTIFCICGIPLTTDAGQYIMQLLDNYGVGTAVFLYAILETVGLMWIYGVNQFSSDAKFMLHRSVGLFWKVTWSFAAPITLIIIFIYGNVDLAVNNESTPGIPWWGSLIGWLLAALAVLQIPIWATVVVYRTPGKSLLEKIRKSVWPAADWGPVDPSDYERWVQWKQQKQLEKSGKMACSSYDNTAYMHEMVSRKV